MLAGFLLIALPLVGVGAGCSDRGEPGTRDARTPADSSPEPAGRPYSLRGTLSLEGMPEPFTFYLFDSRRAGMAVEFLTYVPSDLIAETVASAEGESVRFVANFVGRRSDDTWLHVFFPSPGTTETVARTRARQAAESRGESEPWAGVTPRYAWSLAEHRPRTAAALVRRSYRNWFQPHYPHVHASFRCVEAA